MKQNIRGDRAALIILVLAKFPLAIVATSLVDAKRTVVAKSVMFSTNQVLLPSGAVSQSGLLI